MRVEHAVDEGRALAFVGDVFVDGAEDGAEDDGNLRDQDAAGVALSKAAAAFESK